jgi:hypothetical protein
MNFLLFINSFSKKNNFFKNDRCVEFIRENIKA